MIFLFKKKKCHKQVCVCSGKRSSQIGVFIPVQRRRTSPTNRFQHRVFYLGKTSENWFVSFRDLQCHFLSAISTTFYQTYSTLVGLLMPAFFVFFC